MSTSTFKVPLQVPLRVRVGKKTLEREDFYSWLWATFSDCGLLGVHEGTLLSDEADEQGLKTEAWAVDAAEAPRERDWVSQQKVGQADLFFASEEEAQAAVEHLSEISNLQLGEIEEQKPQDWDAQWKASFLADKNGVRIEPYWRILPPWVDASEVGLRPDERVLRINPGAGFGTGTHETTQLCLKAIAEVTADEGLHGARVLDFGSGSGILAIGAALLGARVDAVEIDPLAIENAGDNAKLNQVESPIRFALTFDELPDAGPYRLVIANILRPVLLQFAEELVRRIAPGGALILSGLIETDLPEVITRYATLLGKKPKIGAVNEWRSLVWE